ncbi:DUF72 domain-containing protein [Duganella sp. Root336D2]|uniref:DUF72 domain-containing protein n=1 Tax=unclassified Duganella TaxID=2636909 RepID=UPI0035A282B1
MRAPEQPLANVFASGVLLLRKKLGPFLWQFPPNFKFDEDLFEHFLSVPGAAPTRLGGAAGRDRSRIGPRT